MGTCHQVAIATCKGAKCQVEGMKYIFSSLSVFRGGENSFWGLFTIHFLVRRRGSQCMENMIITLFAEKIL
jgi:hypothetical protein